MQSGRTNTDAALRTALTDIFVPSGGDRPNVPNIIILITDGVPNPHNQTQLNKTVEEVKNSGTRIIATGVGTGVDNNVMQQIVTPPASENYIRSANFDDIAQQIDNILRRACTVCRPRPKTCKYEFFGDLCYL